MAPFDTSEEMRIVTLLGQIKPTFHFSEDGKSKQLACDTEQFHWCVKQIQTLMKTPSNAGKLGARETKNDDEFEDMVNNSPTKVKGE